MKTLILSLVVLFLSACAKEQPTQPTIPSDWHKVSAAEESTGDSLDNQSIEAFEKNNPALVEAVASQLSLTESALENAIEQTRNAEIAPPNPWKVQAFMTDLTVSTQGVIGGLIGKGSPSVYFLWRKQYLKTQPIQFAPSESAPDLVLNEQSFPSSVEAQLEPAIKATLAAGKINDERNFRSKLLKAAADFRDFASAIGDGPGQQWWVSRIRLDLSIDGSGNVTPVMTAGGDLRFRFEWHRIMPKKKMSLLMGSKEKTLELNGTLAALAQDLSVLADSSEIPNFTASSFRVGIGASAKGDIGIVKGSAGLMGHVYFIRNTKKPVVNPKPIDETQPISMAGSDTFIDRAKFRKGLIKATKIAAFFVRRIPTHADAKWKIYEMKTGLDMSGNGKLSLVEVSGLASAEIAFFNNRF